MSTHRHPFTNAIQYNAIFPWNHAIDAFCTCVPCHEARKQKILNKCNVLEQGLDQLVWPNGQPTAELPPSNISYLPDQHTTIARMPKKEG